MTVMVDEIRVWPTKIPWFKGGSAHLTADTLPELHAFASRLGLQRRWFQEHPVHPHYDLTPDKRDEALAMGAVLVPAKEQARKRLIARGWLPTTLASRAREPK